jgi:hypothetical protein
LQLFSFCFSHLWQGNVIGLCHFNQFIPNFGVDLDTLGSRLFVRARTALTAGGASV